MSDANSVLMGGAGGTKSFSWKGLVEGQGVEGKVTRIGDAVQAKKFGTDNELKTWPDGNPVMTVPIELATAERDPSEPEDDGARALWVEQSTALQKAIANAVIAAGKSAMEVGGTLKVWTSGFEPTNKGNDKRLFAATWTPPGANVVMGGAAPAAAPATPAASAAPATPAAPPVATGGIDINSLTPEMIALLQAAQAAK